jgi:hypothetical protein
MTYVVTSSIERQILFSTYEGNQNLVKDPGLFKVRRINRDATDKVQQSLAVALLDAFQPGLVHSVTGPSPVIGATHRLITALITIRSQLFHLQFINNYRHWIIDLHLFLFWAELHGDGVSPTDL